MSTLTASLVDAADAIKDKLVTNMNVLGLKNIYYGDDDFAPAYPFAGVAPQPKDRDFATTSQFDVKLRTAITLYFGKLQMPEVNSREADILAENVEALLHSDFKLGGLVIFGFVSRVEPGVARTARGIVLKATRLLWEAHSRETFHL